STRISSPGSPRGSRYSFSSKRRGLTGSPTAATSSAAGRKSSARLSAWTSPGHDGGRYLPVTPHSSARRLPDRHDTRESAYGEQRSGRNLRGHRKSRRARPGEWLPAPADRASRRRRGDPHGT